MLWSIQTIEKGSTKKTPFMVVYGSEVMLPVKVTIHTRSLAAGSGQVFSVVVGD